MQVFWSKKCYSFTIVRTGIGTVLALCTQRFAWYSGSNLLLWSQSFENTGIKNEKGPMQVVQCKIHISSLKFIFKTFFNHNSFCHHSIKECYFKKKKIHLNFDLHPLSELPRLESTWWDSESWWRYFILWIFSLKYFHQLLKTNFLFY